MSLVNPGRREGPPPVGRATRSTVLLSLALHAGVLAVVVVVPLFGHVTLPRTADTRPVAAFVRAAATPDVPPPPMAARPPRAAAAQGVPSRTVPAVSAPVPLEPPDALPAGEAPAYVPGARLHGVPSGALAGVGAGIADGAAIGAPPPPVEPEPAPIRVGGQVEAPRKLHHVAPVYPSIAVQARVTGTVILEATISTTGEVTGVRVLRSVPLLDAAAVNAVRQWRYEPPRLNGTPVAVLLTVTVRFGQ